MKKSVTTILLCCILYSSINAQQFKVSYTPTALNESFTGNLYVYLSKDIDEPRYAFVGLEQFTCFRLAVKNLRPGQSVTVNDNAVCYPVVPSDMERGEYNVQAVWDRNLGGRSIAETEGNIFNKPVKMVITQKRDQAYTIVCDQVMPGRPFTETEFVKELKAPSKLLSDFHKKSYTVNAAVQLPAEYYKEPERKFPVLFSVFGYGADYRYYSNVKDPSAPIDTVPCIKVYLDGNCPLGHSVYTNSDNNGPWGDALTQEFIPLLEQKYRCNGARLLIGHSSGGWTVLSLQVHYPKVFLACTSSSPDYVDFRSVAKVDIYADSNMFYDKDKRPTYGATVAGSFPWASIKNMYRAERAVSRGEQMQSFNAVFGSKGSDGMPAQICDAMTGMINKAEVEHWKKYDLSLYLRNNWNTLKPDLDGKIRVSVGNQDNFLLNHPVKLLEEEMKKIGAGMKFEYYPGDHFTVSTKEYRKDQMNFLRQKYMEWVEKGGGN
jgi:S-formylglutathione hydrolase FrmB